MEEPSYSTYSKKEDFKGQKRKKRVSKYLPNFLGEDNKAKMNILEIGCGHGDNMAYLYKKGYHTVTGIDKDPTVCKKANIHNSDWKDYIPVKQFDAIYGVHFFEHLQDPRAFFEWIKGVLRPGGKFVFEVPSIDDPLIKLYKNDAYDKFCWYPYHMFFYSKETISKIFSGFDFQVYRRQEYGIINHLRWALLGIPGNLNKHIPILDDIYKAILKKFGYSDSLVVVGNV
jgi:SAM-dependent methyltransferase